MRTRQRLTVVVVAIMSLLVGFPSAASAADQGTIQPDTTVDVTVDIEDFIGAMASMTGCCSVEQASDANMRINVTLTQGATSSVSRLVPMKCNLRNGTCVAATPDTSFSGSVLTTEGMVSTGNAFTSGNATLAGTSDGYGCVILICMWAPGPAVEYELTLS